MPAFIGGHNYISNLSFKTKVVESATVTGLRLAIVIIDSAFAIEVYLIIQLRQRLINWEYNRKTNIVASIKTKLKFYFFYQIFLFLNNSIF